MRVLIIGAGKQGAFCDIDGTGCEHKVISHAKAFKMHGGFDLVGFYDKDDAAMRRAGIEWGATWYDRLEDAFTNNIDVVSICTPDDTHYEVLDRVYKFKPRLVLCEKPIATDLDQAKEIAARYEEAGIPILVNYTRRFIPELQAFKNRINNSEFGKFLWGSGVFNRGWLHTATHMIDFVYWLLEGRVEGDFSIHEVKDANYRIFQLDLFFEKIHWRMQSGPRVEPMFNLHMWYVVDNIYRYLTGKEQLRCTGRDAVNALEVCFTLKEAAHHDR